VNADKNLLTKEQVAELQGLRVIDTDKRRALVMSALLGREGSEAIQGSLGLTTLFWAAQYLAQMPLPTVKTINKELTRRMAKRMATKSGALALGRLIEAGRATICNLKKPM